MADHGSILRRTRCALRGVLGPDESEDFRLSIRSGEDDPEAFPSTAVAVFAVFSEDEALPGRGAAPGPGTVLGPGTVPAGEGPPAAGPLDTGPLDTGAAGVRGGADWAPGDQDGPASAEAGRIRTVESAGFSSSFAFFMPDPPLVVSSVAEPSVSGAEAPPSAGDSTTSTTSASVALSIFSVT
ncbi:hypothetical protein Ppa06_25360 [Planomonospora parontospora subsp. parontospora]|uniref:Uncharacterized protein n=2 Tax=Planomonospora parontospora TaxID=58119 RepID=A0AA37F3W5_9ACTN|nr:hypothetical protein GCM10010126_20320 [Planomonospora parontospora]GII08738.1 hypothetical protein Ppa06_25360 [Planomonospora parontospora subsp. parontospora]